MLNHSTEQLKQVANCSSISIWSNWFILALKKENRPLLAGVSSFDAVSVVKGDSSGGRRRCSYAWPN